MALGLLLVPCVVEAAVLETRASQPNILLITIDTLRRDAVGWIGGHDRTPTIDRLAREGHRFPTTVSPVPLTLPAHVSLLTGLEPPAHGVRDNGQLAAADLATLPEQLGQAGYQTAAFVSGFPLRRTFGLDAGFMVYDDDLPLGEEGFNERRADATVAACAAWLRTAKPPWFAWLHLYDPHEPYDPPREFWSPSTKGAYSGEVEFVDAALGQLMAGRWDDSSLLVVLTADHGEALGEHDEDTHGYYVYDSTTLVPLLFRRPGTVRPGQTDQQVGLIDVAPTLLESAGIAVGSGIAGRSLAEALRGRTLPRLSYYLETRLPWHYFGWAPLVALRREDAKLIVAPRSELYLLGPDPGERNNVIEHEELRRRQLRAELRERSRQPARPSEVTSDADALAKLQALGYLGSGGTDGESPSDLPDPKDRVELRRRLVAADRLLREGQLAAAAAAFDRVLEVEPRNRMALLRAGFTLLRQGQLTPALERLRAATQVDPNRAEGRYLLGDALLLSNQPEAAAEQYAYLTRLQPRRFEAWLNLATALEAAGRRAEATKALATAMPLATGRPEVAAIEALRLRLGGATTGR